MKANLGPKNQLYVDNLSSDAFYQVFGVSRIVLLNIIRR